MKTPMFFASDAGGLAGLGFARQRLAWLPALLLAAACLVPDFAMAQVSKTVYLRGTNTATGAYILSVSNAQWRSETYMIWRNSGDSESHPNGELRVLQFRPVNGYYTPPDAEVTWNTTPETFFYKQWTNTFDVTVDPVEAVWTLAGPDGFTAFNYGVRTGNVAGVSCPTGTYTVTYQLVRDYYAATNSPQTMAVTGAVNGAFASVYRPFTNSITVEIEGITTADDVLWRITNAPAQFTNSSAYRGASGVYTNNYIVTPVPTGAVAYAIRYPDIVGYTPPSPQTTNVLVYDDFSPVVTGVYTRLTNGVINIVASPTNATWTITAYPADYAGPFSGTGSTNISDVPIGTYTVNFNPLSGYTSPSPNPVTQTVNDGQTVTYTGNYTSTGRRLTVHVILPGETNLQGVGDGFVQLQPLGAADPNNPEVFTYPINSEVTLRAIPTNIVVGGVSYRSFFFEWFGRRLNANGTWQNDLGGYGAPPSYINPITLTLDVDRQVTVLFSRAAYPWDDAGDLDGDGLPDTWELQYGLNPKRATTTDGAYGNSDGDWIPSVVTNPPTMVMLSDTSGSPAGDMAGGISWVSYAGVNGAIPGYPLRRTRMLTPQTLGAGSDRLGYGGGVPFHNLLECRGFDGFLGTNGGNFLTATTFTNYWVANDDPGTDPLSIDTDEDGFCDGWEYYFWYWRSASAYSRGLTNTSANLSWVTIHPTLANADDWDTDGDGHNDATEYILGTDPTHADTDGDGMDDWWEYFYDLNYFDYSDSMNNTDADYMAIRRDIGVLEMTNGLMDVVNGTLFADDVYYVGAALTNADAAWVDVDGDAAFTLYTDTILLGAGTLTNRMTGTLIADDVYFGMASGLPRYLTGYPVWVDIDGDGAYTVGTDAALVNPRIKHELVYMSPPIPVWPGETAFAPVVAWYEGAMTASYTLTNSTGAGTNIFSRTITWTGPWWTERYNAYQEYLGGDYHGRLSWDAGGRVISENDDWLFPARTASTAPDQVDTDTDGIPDGWELYVGLHPSYALDAALDPDSDGLSNLEEWANTVHATGQASAWDTKIWPSDPGVVTAPGPNDPHPRDTDWDGVRDGLERDNLTAPVLVDTDSDGLPDGWELYAGTSPRGQDADEDTDGDGLLNWQEYWTGTVPEWQYCNPSWGMKFLSRWIMWWDFGWGDPTTGTATPYFMPPDFMSCPSFLYENGIITDFDLLRGLFPATNCYGYSGPNGGYEYYKTTLAGPDNFHDNDNPTDSDQDGMDDFWEVYHCLNPLTGYISLIDGSWNAQSAGFMPIVGTVDADPGQPGYQVGLSGAPFNSVVDLINYFNANVRSELPNTPGRVGALAAIVGPHYFGCVGNDVDDDGYPNFEEYTYYRKSLLHTCPAPLWRTDPYASGVNSFVARNYTRDYTPQSAGWNVYGFSGITHSDARGSRPFRWAAMAEGFDTDGDLLGDFHETTGYRTNGTVAASNPLDDQSPLHNRVLWLDGTNSWCRSYAWSHYGDFSKFSVEAWVRPSRLIAPTDQVIVEKSSGYTVQTPLGPSTVSLANFQLGISANGIPYVLFHGKTGFTTQRASASSLAGQLRVNEWIHLAGVFDGAKLTLYVNGDASATHHTTDVPARGIEGNYDIWHPNCNLSVGARELNCGWHFPVSGEKFFAGCIDEVRVWDRVLTQSEVVGRKDRRLNPDEIGTILPGNAPYMQGENNLFAYYTFNSLPDPAIEGIAPSEFPAASRPAPSINYSLVYTNNYLVMAADRVKRIPRMLPLDTRVIDGAPVPTSTNVVSTNFVTTDSYGISCSSNGYLNFQLPDDFRNPANPYNFTHDAFNIDMGRGMWMVGYAQGKKPVDTWLPTIDPDNPDSMDSDGDGLPDWWEIANGLDPYDATGDNGRWGDPDGDGLSNWAEYMAGTSPTKWDTDGDGRSDYDSRSDTDPFALTWGELYDDGDNMPDWWEYQYGLDPYKYDAHLDKDGDGWSNYQEYLAGTDPSSSASIPRPSVSGSIVYTGARNGTIRVVGYQTNAMDGTVKAMQIGLDSTVSEVVGYANGTRSYVGRLPYAPVTEGTTIKISAIMYWLRPGNVVTYSYATFTFTGPATFTYDGVGQGVAAGADGRLDYNTGEFSLTWANDEVPYEGNEISVSYPYIDPVNPRYSFAGFGEGEVYLAAYFSEAASSNANWEAGSPFGVAHGQPYYLNYTDLRGGRIYLHDSLAGYNRFAWRYAGDASTTNVNVRVNKTGTGGSPDLLNLFIRSPRNYLHEWDYQRSGLYGLPTGNYRWWAGVESGTFSINLVPPARAHALSPSGNTLYDARGRFEWVMCTNATMYRLQVARQESDGRLVMVEDNLYPAPGCDRDGVYRDYFPPYASEWGDGVYFWRVAGWNPSGQGPWSGDDLNSVQTFHIDLNPSYTRVIRGNIYYYGKVLPDRVVLEVFDNAGFSGAPVALLRITPPRDSNPEKIIPYTLLGLPEGVFYLRAYIDTTPAGKTASGVWEYWKTQGFVRDDNNRYRPGRLALITTRSLRDQKIVLRDRDTDSDLLPDAWEMEYFGNLDQTGDMDYDGDGETNLDEYRYAGGIMNPARHDSDGDGLSDWFEMNYNPVHFGFRHTGAQLNPTRWDTDGDGYSDGAELRRYNTNPLDSGSFPQYMPPCYGPSPSPGDYDGDGRTDAALFDPVSGSWYIYTMGGLFGRAPFGNGAMMPLVGDYDGDGRTDLALYNPAAGRWHVYTMSGITGELPFGDANMTPVPADYTGDMRTDFGLFDRVTATWYFYTLDGRFYSLRHGAPTHVPVPGDYDGDGRVDPAVYDAGSGVWSIRTWLGYSANMRLGGPGQIPVPGDYDGDGRTDLATFDAATGYWRAYTSQGRSLEGPFGWYGVIPVPGDYDGDGRTDPAIYDPPTGMWYVYLMNGRMVRGQFGWSGAAPVLGRR